MPSQPDPRTLARLSAQALYHQKRGDVAAATEAHAAVVESLEDMRAVYEGSAALDQFDDRYNRRYEPAIQFFLETGQVAPALSLVDRTRFRSGCDARSGRVRFGSPVDVAEWPPNPCSPGELLLVEWLQLTREWSISYRPGVTRPELREVRLGDGVAPRTGGRNAPPWFADFAVARERAQRMIDTYADVLDEYSRVTIVPHGVQWRAPWAALTHPRRGRPLHESHEIALLPSLRWDRIMRASSPDLGRRPSLVIGDPTGDSDAAGTEARQIAERLETTPLLGSDATVAAVRTAFANRPYDVVHYAGHGSYDGHELTGLRLADGVLTAGDVAGSGMDAGLVYLASCWSGVTAFSVWNELHGFVRAALVGGTRYLVASSYPLGDRVGGLVSARFYDQYLDRQDGRSPHPATALRRSVGELPDSVAVETWGSLFVTGDRG